MLIAIAAAASPAPDVALPITVRLLPDRGYARFENARHPGNRVGYRFHEHTPLIEGDAPGRSIAATLARKRSDTLEQQFRARPGVQSRVIVVAEADWAPQLWTYYLVPVADGVELLWVVETQDVPLNSYYGVQQCFRMGGVTNDGWRREIAEAPAFSEYDLWKGAEKDRDSKTSLTHVRRNGAWQCLPATTNTVGARTPLGVRVDTRLTNGHLETMPEVGPYHARMLDPIDDAPAARMNREGTWVCGLYWEHASHVTDHHPADCLHCIVDIGDLPAHSKRALRGKIYWFEGDLHDLDTHWRQDFRQDAPRQP